MKKILTVLFFFSLLAAVLPFYVLAQGSEVKQAIALMNSDKNDEAITLLVSALRMSPDNYEAVLALGMAYLKKNDYDNAVSTLERAVVLNAASVSPQYYLALLYEKSREFAKAKNSWNNVYNLSHDKELKGLAVKHLKHLENY